MSELGDPDVWTMLMSFALITATSIASAFIAWIALWLMADNDRPLKHSGMDPLITGE